MRDSEKDIEYFTKRIEFREKLVDEKLPVAESFPRVEGRPGNAASLCMYTFQICVLRYGRGDAMEKIGPSIWRWVEAKEIESKMISQIPPERKNEKVMYERLTLDTVYDALSMMAFAKALHFNAAEMKRLIDAIGHPGEDALIDEERERWVTRNDPSRMRASSQRYTTRCWKCGVAILQSARPSCSPSPRFGRRRSSRSTGLTA